MKTRRFECYWSFEWSWVRVDDESVCGWCCGDDHITIEKVCMERKVSRMNPSLTQSFFLVRVLTSNVSIPKDKWNLCYLSRLFTCLWTCFIWIHLKTGNAKWIQSLSENLIEENSEPTLKKANRRVRIADEGKRKNRKWNWQNIEIKHGKWFHEKKRQTNTKKSNDWKMIGVKMKDEIQKKGQSIRKTKTINRRGNRFHQQNNNENCQVSSFHLF